jgi:PPOX class probable F420-dependent enzyme
MTTHFTDRVQKLLSAANLANLATVGSRGAPCVQPVWFNVDGSTLCLNSIEGRAWPRRVRKDSRVSLSIVNAQETTEYVEIRGRIIEDTHDGADAHIDVLSRRYLGIDYPNRFEGEQRIFFRVQPERVLYVNLLDAIPAAPFGDQRG